MSNLPTLQKIRMECEARKRTAVANFRMAFNPKYFVNRLFPICFNGLSIKDSEALLEGCRVESVIKVSTLPLVRQGDKRRVIHNIPGFFSFLEMPERLEELLQQFLIVVNNLLSKTYWIVTEIAVSNVGTKILCMIVTFRCRTLPDIEGDGLEAEC